MFRPVDKITTHTFRVSLLLFKIVFVLSMFVLLVFVAEGLTRFKYSPQKISFEGIFEYDPQTIFRLKKNLIDGYFENSHVYTNNFGYRGENFYAEKLPNEWRILFLGDSITFGHGVENNETFVYKYQMSLSEKNADKKILAINTGVPGYSAMQEYFEFKKALKFRPDVAVIQFTLNDVTEPYFFQRNLGGTGIDYHKVADVPFWHFYLSQHSSFYLFLLDTSKWIKFGSTNKTIVQDIAKNDEAVSSYELIINPNSQNVNKEWATYFYWMQKITDICHENAISCYVMISPYSFQLERPQADDFPQKRILEFAKQNNIIAIDILSILREKYVQILSSQYNLPFDTSYEYIIQNHHDDIRLLNDTYFLDSDHYTPVGHDFVKNELLKIVNNFSNM